MNGSAELEEEVEAPPKPDLSHSHCYVFCFSNALCSHLNGMDWASLHVEGRDYYFKCYHDDVRRIS